MNNIVIIADDLTGAADTGVQFSSFFEETTLISYHFVDRMPGSTQPSASRATALYTNSRALPADAAYRRLATVAQQLAGEKFAWIYKKIDSCMRGNVASEADALLDELNFEASFMTPAFPEMGRTTRENIHLVHGVPLGRTELARDPITPIKESRLSRIVQSQSRHPVYHVGLNLLENDQNQFAKEIKRQLSKGVRHFVIDAASRNHLDRIAELILCSEHNILPIGSAGLAGSMANLLTSRSASDATPILSLSDGFNLLVCGTASAVTAQQIDMLLGNLSYDVLQLNPALLTGQAPRKNLLELKSKARSKLLQKNLILTIKPAQNDGGSPQHEGFQHSADSIVRGLGLLVADVVARAKPGNLFLTGGDTADAVLTAIEADGIRIVGEVVAGVVQGELIGGLLSGLPVVTKAGAFGQKDTLVMIHEYWRRLRQGS